MKRVGAGNHPFLPRHRQSTKVGILFLLSSSYFFASTTAATDANTRWTFLQPSTSMEWTPMVTTEIVPTTELPTDNQEEEVDLWIISIPHNTTNLSECKDNTALQSLDQRFNGTIAALLESKTKGVVTQHYYSNGGGDAEMSTNKPIRIKLVELPKEKDIHTAGRKLGTAVAITLKAEKKVASCAVVLPSLSDDDTDLPSETFVSDCVSSILSGLYKDTRFKSSSSSSPSDKKKDGSAVDKDVERISLVLPTSTSGTIDAFDETNLQTDINRGVALAHGLYLAKDIVNAPHNTLHSQTLKETAHRLATQSRGRLTCRVLDYRACERLGMGAYLGVARGSETEPAFLHLSFKYKGRRRSSRRNPKRLGIIGKGLLMDTGGYNIKTSGMELMKFDCGGAAAVLGAARALTMLPKDAFGDETVEVHFCVAACENMINERAVVPGDILTAANGKTIEVINTDAEGRLTMADALVYVDQQLKCSAILELSTLTGSCMAALGPAMAGVFTQDDDLAQQLEKIAKSTGDRLWRLPMEAEYKDGLKSKIADLRNIGTGRLAGAITAALFLQNFVNDKVPFAHVDMAGTVWNTKAGSATGWGVKLVTNWVVAASE